jgi:DNA-binding MarR family transcriptional regulator
MRRSVLPAYQQMLTLIFELPRALRCCQQDQIFCENLTLAQFSVLNAIAEKGEMKLADLHFLLSVEKSTTTRLVDPLTRKGWVQRKKSDHDSRAQMLMLTREGKIVHQKILECLIGFMEKIQMGIPEQRRKDVYQGAQIFLTALKNACNGRMKFPKMR